MLEYRPTDNELLAVYGLRTLNPTAREDLTRIENNYSQDLTSLSTEEQFKLLEKLHDSGVKEVPNHTHDFEDPLKGRGSNIVQDLLRKQIVKAHDDPRLESFLVSSRDFNAYKYLNSVHKDTSLQELDGALRILENGIHLYTDDLKHSIEQNFDRFIDCKQRIDRSLNEFVNQKTRMQQEKDNSKVFNPRRHKIAGRGPAGGQELSSELELSLNNLITSTSLMLRPISDNRTREGKIATIVEFVKENSFFFNLSANLIQALSSNDDNKFINEYNRYVREKEIFLQKFQSNIAKENDMSKTQKDKNNRQGQLSSAADTDASFVQDSENDNTLKLALISTVFNEVDEIARQYRNKVHAELLSLDHEANKNGTEFSTDNAKFMTLVESLLKLTTEETSQSPESQGQGHGVGQLGPVRDFLLKQIEIINKDFEYQVGKFDSRFLLMQNKLVDYVSSLKAERRSGSHVNYIADKYEKYKEEIKFAKTNDEKLRTIDEAFESNDSLDLSLINETWLVLLNFLNYLEVLFLRLADKFVNNYSHYYRLGVDPNGEIRDEFFVMINQVVAILTTLFDDETKDADGVNQLESSPSNYKQFVPCYANSLSSVYHLGRIQVLINNFMQKLGNIVGVIGNISKFQDTNRNLKQLRNSSLQINQKILEAVCSTWVNDCSQFYEMEDWKIEDKYNTKDGSCTKLMNIIEYYQLYMIRKIAKITMTSAKENTNNNNTGSNSNINSEFAVVANYPSKRILMSIEIQFMRTLNIVVDSMMKKYNIDRQIYNETEIAKGANIELFKILTMNNFDKLSRITYPRLIFEFDKQYTKSLSKQNLKLFSDIDQASLTIIEDILSNEKGYVSNLTSDFFAKFDPSNFGDRGERIEPLENMPMVDGFVYQVLMHFVKLVFRMKPLTSEEVFVTILNELQSSFLKNILDCVRNSQQHLSRARLSNLMLDVWFLWEIFEGSNILRFNDASKKLYDVLVNEIESMRKDGAGVGAEVHHGDYELEEALKIHLQSTAIQFNCF
ncbi:uncharacterized protein LODBEIA_P41860 [Lodderomyces beijingensis]|uniref:Exocyst complex component SEC5 n=1 Tax=Lodderomyces beijingensis TaxID=1775926 RepID=A0ABP0ZUJ5_9ASCO